MSFTTLLRRLRGDSTATRPARRPGPHQRPTPSRPSFVPRLDVLEQRLTLINQLLGSTSNPAAQAALQAARETLSGKKSP